MTFNEFKAIIVEKFPEVTPEQMDRFEKMDALYREWNAKINVVSRKDMDELYRHHILHSLGIAAFLKTQMPDIYDRLRGEGPYSLSEPMKLLDLGTGGGFPGIPLAVMFPHAQFTLCESIGKKIIVATEVSKGLGLKNVTTVNARAETLPDTYNYIVFHKHYSFYLFPRLSKYSAFTFLTERTHIIETAEASTSIAMSPGTKPAPNLPDTISVPI